MKRLMLIFMTITVSTIFAQSGIAETDTNLTRQVYGVVVHGNQQYLVTDKGFIPVQKYNDPWGEYYRQIYGDSTITNPNTEIKGEDGGVPYIMPMINVGDWVEKNYGFEGEMYLYDFMEMDSTGNYVYRPGALAILAQMKSDKPAKLPQPRRK